MVDVLLRVLLRRYDDVGGVDVDFAIVSIWEVKNRYWGIDTAR